MKVQDTHSSFFNGFAYKTFVLRGSGKLHKKKNADEFQGEYPSHWVRDKKEIPFHLLKTWAGPIPEKLSIDVYIKVVALIFSFSISGKPFLNSIPTPRYINSNKTIKIWR